MTDDNSNLVDMDNLENFSKTFFSDEPVATSAPEDKPKEAVEDVNETEDDALATEHDVDATEGEEPTADDKPEDKPKGKKSYQERINELTAARREAERREEDLRRRLAELEQGSRKPEVEQKSEAPKPLREQLSDGAPNPDAKNEAGELVYPLGEFDPAFIRDLTRHTIEQETKAAKEQAAKSEQQRMVEAAQEELKSSWLDKVTAAEEELPDLREKLLEMDSAFAGIDPQYGEFLAATIMSCDNGPQIMYYLSQNIGEAQKIVASGPAAATRTLGRLDAKFDKAGGDDKRDNKRVSNAPKPPMATTRGQGGRFSVAPDTTDLEAFKREFFK